LRAPTATYDFEPFLLGTAEEAWTKYIVLSRTGSANQLESSSRTFDPVRLYEQIKYQSNQEHRDTQVRVVLQLADVRVLALGILDTTQTSMYINDNAKRFLHPPDIDGLTGEWYHSLDGNETYDSTSLAKFSRHSNRRLGSNYVPLKNPDPDFSFRRYPFLTEGDADRRWTHLDSVGEGEKRWIGSLLITAQLVVPGDRRSSGLEHAHTTSPRYVSFTWEDFRAIAPWMKYYVSKYIDGEGLGLP